MNTRRLLALLAVALLPATLAVGCTEPATLTFTEVWTSSNPGGPQQSIILKQEHVKAVLVPATSFCNLTDAAGVPKPDGLTPANVACYKGQLARVTWAQAAYTPEVNAQINAYAKRVWDVVLADSPDELVQITLTSIAGNGPPNREIVLQDNPEVPGPGDPDNEVRFCDCTV